MPYCHQLYVSQLYSRPLLKRSSKGILTSNLTKFTPCERNRSGVILLLQWGWNWVNSQIFKLRSIWQIKVGWIFLEICSWPRLRQHLIKHICSVEHKHNACLPPPPPPPPPPGDGRCNPGSETTSPFTFPIYSTRKKFQPGVSKIFNIYIWLYFFPL